MGLVALSCYFSVSPIVAVLCEIPEDFLGLTDKPWHQRILRTVLLLLVSVVAYFISSDLAIVEAVTGSVCTMLTSVVCPAIFFGILYAKELGKCYKVGLSILALAGSVYGIFLFYQGIVSLFLFSSLLFHFEM